MDEKKLVVSVHDVTPKFRGELSEIIQELSIKGIAKRSLLVVPNWDHTFDLRGYDTFAAWLHELQDSGDEIVQHGYTHQAIHREYGTPAKWFMGEMFAQGTGEFQNMNYSQARFAIEEGKAVFRDVKLDEVTGFIAPAWLLNEEVEQVLSHQEFKYTVYTDFFKYVTQLSVIPIKNLKTGEEIRSREIAFEGSRKIIDWGTRTLAAAIASNEKNPLMRIAIHPQDIHNERPFDYALGLLEKLSKDRELATYNELS